jgi:hypothetical protein
MTTKKLQGNDGINLLSLLVRESVWFFQKKNWIDPGKSIWFVIRLLDQIDDRVGFKTTKLRKFIKLERVGAHLRNVLKARAVPGDAVERRSQVGSSKPATEGVV